MEPWFGRIKNFLVRTPGPMSEVNQERAYHALRQDDAKAMTGILLSSWEHAPDPSTLMDLLTVAMKDNRQKCLRILMDLAPVDSNEFDVLRQAASYGQTQVCDRLLRHRPNVPASLGWVLNNALLCQQDQVVDLVMQYMQHYPKFPPRPGAPQPKHVEEEVRFYDGPYLISSSLSVGRRDLLDQLIQSVSGDLRLLSRPRQEILKTFLYFFDHNIKDCFFNRTSLGQEFHQDFSRAFGQLLISHPHSMMDNLLKAVEFTHNPGLLAVCVGDHQKVIQDLLHQYASHPDRAPRRFAEDEHPSSVLGLLYATSDKTTAVLSSILHEMNSDRPSSDPPIVNTRMKMFLTIMTPWFDLRSVMMELFEHTPPGYTHTCELLWRALPQEMEKIMGENIHLLNTPEHALAVEHQSPGLWSAWQKAVLLNACEPLPVSSRSRRKM